METNENMTDQTGRNRREKRKPGSTAFWLNEKRPVINPYTFLTESERNDKTKTYLPVKGKSVPVIIDRRDALLIEKLLPGHWIRMTRMSYPAIPTYDIFGGRFDLHVSSFVGNAQLREKGIRPSDRVIAKRIEKPPRDVRTSNLKITSKIGTREHGGGGKNYSKSMMPQWIIEARLIALTSGENPNEAMKKLISEFKLENLRLERNQEKDQVSKNFYLKTSQGHKKGSPSNSPHPPPIIEGGRTSEIR